MEYVPKFESIAIDKIVLTGFLDCLSARIKIEVRIYYSELRPPVHNLYVTGRPRLALGTMQPIMLTAVWQAEEFFRDYFSP